MTAAATLCAKTDAPDANALVEDEDEPVGALLVAVNKDLGAALGDLGMTSALLDDAADVSDSMDEDDDSCIALDGGIM